MAAYVTLFRKLLINTGVLGIFTLSNLWTGLAQSLQRLATGLDGPGIEYKRKWPNLHITRTVRNGKIWRRVESYHLYVLSSKRTLENGRGRL